MNHGEQLEVVRGIDNRGQLTSFELVLATWAGKPSFASAIKK